MFGKFSPTRAVSIIRLVPSAALWWRRLLIRERALRLRPFEFEAIGIGTTALPLSENPLNVWAAAGSPVNPAMIAGSVSVTAVPVPAAAWMFVSALGLLGWIRQQSV